MSHPSERAANIRDHHVREIVRLNEDIELHEVVIFVQDCIIEGVDARSAAEELRDVTLDADGGDSQAGVVLPRTAAILDDLLTVSDLDEEFGGDTEYPHSANKDEKITYVINLYTED